MNIVIEYDQKQQQATNSGNVDDELRTSPTIVLECFLHNFEWLINMTSTFVDFKVESLTSFDKLWRTYADDGRCG
jgi:hypothetical protein